jgi:TRAP-type C4-dicarboxylate transport system substrate-binding protein
MRAWALLMVVIGTAWAAEPRTLRMGAIAPEGTAWARELKAFARELESATGGNLRVKLYLGGVAGDDVQMGERLKKGQIDLAASAGMLCQRAMPSMGLFRVRGLFQSRDEASFVLSALGATFREEAKRAGLVFLGSAILGNDVPFLRSPVNSLADLQKVKLWQWDLDTIGVASMRASGLSIVPLPVEEAGRAFLEGRVDGFVAIPSAILGFQWHAHTHFLLDLRMGILPGCLVATERLFDQLSNAEQSALKTAAAKLGARFTQVTQVTQEQDEALLGGLFAKSGVRPIPLDQRFRSDLLASTRRARDQLIETGVIPREMAARIATLLADHRAERR